MEWNVVRAVCEGFGGFCKGGWTWEFGPYVGQVGAKMGTANVAEKCHDENLAIPLDNSMARWSSHKADAISS